MHCPTIPESVEFNTLFPATTLDTIAELEDQIDFTFPDDYKRFLLKQNGLSILSDTEFPLQKEFDDLTALELSKIYGVAGASDSFSVQWGLAIPGFRDRSPGGLVPIGNDSNSFFICYSQRKRTPNVVVFADHGFDGYPASREELTKRILPVANTFTEFLESLRPLEDQW